MRPLPAARVASFAATLENVWWKSRSRTKRRDALLLGSCLLGLRSREALSIRLSDIDFLECMLRVRTAKGGPGRTLPAGISWCNAVRVVRSLFKPGRGRDDKVWLTTRGNEVAYEHLLRRCRQWTFVHFGEKFSPHCCRHTAAVGMYTATRDVLAVQRLLGHRSLRWTQEYLHTLIPIDVVGLPGFVTGKPFAPGLRLFDPDGLAVRERKRA